ncbi:hypothetical protein C8R44DRAFT_889539 [Mycena epipterygia]|nr:hypothetical protein C8R44DRAFT_889539 [Mycena epipterygia]
MAVGRPADGAGDAGGALDRDQGSPNLAEVTSANLGQPQPTSANFPSTNPVEPPRPTSANLGQLPLDQPGRAPSANLGQPQPTSIKSAEGPSKCSVRASESSHFKNASSQFQREGRGCQ